MSLHPFARFVIVSGIAAIANIVARIVFSLAVPFEYAVILAFPVGMTTAYMLSRHFVFESSPLPARTQYMRFALVNVVALVQVWLVSVGLAEWIFPAIQFDTYPDTVAHTIGVASPAVTSYFGHKWFSFQQAVTRL